jgi:probable phosphoglycerate mutase
MSVTLIIVRHGNTFEPGEPPRRIGARTDLPLVETGREQAYALGHWFAAQGIRFDRALTSPLRRTRETGERLLACTVAAPPLIDADWLAEIDHGPDEDQPEAVVLTRIGRNALAAWDERAIPPPGWIVDAPRRIAAWQTLFAEQQTRASGTILLVTSNGAARFALSALGLDDGLPSLKLRTGAWGRIVIDRHGPVLEAWNQRP